MISIGAAKTAKPFNSLRFLCLENQGRLLEPGTGLDLAEGSGLPSFARVYGGDTVLYIARV